MDYKVECTVDTNDADYNTEISKIDEEQLKMLRSICERIKNFKPYKATYKRSYDNSISEWTHGSNFPIGDTIRDDLGEKSPTELYNLTEEEEEFFVCKICPSTEYGFHTIKSIVIYPYEKGETLI